MVQIYTLPLYVCNEYRSALEFIFKTMNFRTCETAQTVDVERFSIVHEIVPTVLY